MKGQSLILDLVLQQQKPYVAHPKLCSFRVALNSWAAEALCKWNVFVIVLVALGRRCHLRQYLSSLATPALQMVSSLENDWACVWMLCCSCYGPIVNSFWSICVSRIQFFFEGGREVGMGWAISNLKVRSNYTSTILTLDVMYKV